MRGFTNKVITAGITATVLMQGVSGFAKIPADVAGTRYEEPIQVLSALNIMNGDENGAFRPDDTIIRSEVTKMAICALGLSDAAEASKGTSKFPDVPKSHWANGYINLATDMGIIIGDDRGKFRPNDTITYAEAMTIMVRALGYEPKAQEKGGFPSGYILTASETGLTNKVQGTASTPISRGNVAFLTANALETKLMEQTNFGSNPEYGVVNKTLLGDRLGVTKHEGQVIAIPNSSISGESKLSHGQVQIGEEVYETAYNMSNLLGFNVTYYIEDEGKGTEQLILAVPTTGKNKTLTVTSKLFEKTTEKNGKKVIEYFESENSSKTKTAEISPAAKLVYNGKHAELSDELLNIAKKSGTINLLDTDKNGVYDIIFVTVYRNMVVDTVSVNGKITDKYNQPALLLNEDVEYTIEKGLDQLKVSDLKEYDVLSIAESLDKKFYIVSVSDKAITGKVSAKNDDGFVIDGKTYEVADNYTDSITIGLEGKFYLDIDGKIAAIDTSGQLSSNYAYLVRGYETEDEVVKFRFFTKDGKDTTVTAAEKIRVNGSGGKRATEVLASLIGDGKDVTKQLVTYTTNSDGKLTAINTAKDNTSNGNTDTSNFTLNYILDDAIFTEATKKLGNIRLNDQTVIFNIPSDSKDITDYSMATIDMFEDKESYDVLVYDRTEDFTAKAIVVTNANFKTNADSPIAVVKNISTGTNNDDEITDVLRALVGGKEETIFAESEGILKKGDKPLKAGDVIQYKKNADGEIVSIRVLLDIETKATEKAEEPAENLAIIYGKVTKKFSSSINVTVNDGETLNFKISDDVLVYSVDTQVSKNQVTLAEINDIQSFDETEQNRVFIKLYKDMVQEIVIVK